MGPSDVDAASVVARRAHGGQRHGDRPYLAHVAEVAALTAANGGTADEVAAAWLHDVVEDTATTIEDLAPFGPGVTARVDALTRRPDEPVVRYLTRVADAGAGLVKLADRFANTAYHPHPPRTIARYRAEHEAIARILGPHPLVDAIARNLEDRPENHAARDLFADLGRDYDRWASILSAFQDPRWRRRLVARVSVDADADVLDVACGTGAVAAALVHAYGCRVVGIDQSPGMLAGAPDRLAAAGIADRVTLLHGAAERLPFTDARFDGLTSAYLLRYVTDPLAVVREFVRVLRPGAPIGYMDFGLPPSGVPRGAWDLYTGVGLPLAGRAIAPAWWTVGRFLRGSIRTFSASYPPAALGRLFEAAGVRHVRVERLSVGGGVIVSGRADARA